MSAFAALVCFFVSVSAVASHITTYDPNQPAAQTADTKAKELEGVGIDLGHHQGHMGLHPEGAGIVDHDAAGAHGFGHEIAADAATGGREEDVDALEGLGLGP